MPAVCAIVELFGTRAVSGAAVELNQLTDETGAFGFAQLPFGTYGLTLVEPNVNAVAKVHGIVMQDTDDPPEGQGNPVDLGDIRLDGEPP